MVQQHIDFHRQYIAALANHFSDNFSTCCFIELFNAYLAVWNMQIDRDIE